MRNIRFGIGLFLAAFLVVLVIGCGKETVNIPDTTPPQVTATTPVQGATGVTLNAVITATFSKAMNPTTISATTFTVTKIGGAAVTGTVTYAASGSIATFTPTTALAPGTQFTATITTGAQDQASPANALAANSVWNFTTGTAPNPPTVTSTIPLAGATGLPINQTISATFSKAMNPATINSTTFRVTGAGGASVAGVVTYSTPGSVATFTPTANLAYSTLYTATITTTAADPAGSTLASNYVWTFTTGAAPVITLPKVISTIPLNAATGVPLNQLLSATFSEAMNCATLTTPATTFTLTGPGATSVAGTVSCTGSVATFTPAALLVANTLYTATIKTGVTDLAGNALAGNYVWQFRTVPAPTAPTVISTVPVNGATLVATNKAISATFSEAINPATVTSTTFTLTAPGGIPVTGVVTYVADGSVATLTPASALAPNTLFAATITTGTTDLAGTALASDYVWTFTTGAAFDTTKPTVASTIPVNGATAVGFNQVVSATFSEAMNPATINSTTFTLAGPGGTSVAGLTTYAAIGNTAIFTPTATLAPSSLFTATITTGVTDLAGNTLAVNYVWTFTTGAAPDTTPPTVVSTIPLNGASAVPINQTISATFSEAMNPLSLTSATFLLTTAGGDPVTTTVVYDAINSIATLQPTASLASGATYTVTVTTGATDLAGNPLGPGIVPNPWMFTTGAAIIVPPVNLGSAALFGGFGGGAGMTNQGISTVINGNIGTTGVSTLITGFHSNSVGCIYTETPLNVGLVNGAIDTAPPPPTVACPTEGTAVTAAAAAQAALDALAAYNALVAFPNGLDVSTCPGCGGGLAGELGNRTLAVGIYKSAPGSFGITQGDLTLDAKGDPNAFWVFQMATTLTVGTPVSHRSVLLVNGAQAKNVYWQVGTAATINGILGGGTMVGTIISQAAVSISTAGVDAITTLNGRALVLSGPVTMVNTVINVPAP
jgi:Ice-binding-like/Bacterial Ig-like domain